MTEVNGKPEIKREVINESGINLRELLIGDINRLRHIKRFSMSKVLNEESVAEHSFYATMYAYRLARWVKHNRGLTIDMDALMAKCIFHDAEESRTGDFARPFKYSNVHLREEIEMAAELEFSKMIVPLFGDDEQTIAHLSDHWRRSKDKSLEGRIMAIADFLSVLSAIWMEICLGNSTVFQHYDTMQEYAAGFDDVSYEDLRLVVRDIQGLVKRLFADDSLRGRWEAV